MHIAMHAQVEAKMAEISGLMSVFAGKVTEQQEEMESIYMSAVDAHEVRTHVFPLHTHIS